MSVRSRTGPSFTPSGSSTASSYFGVLRDETGGSSDAARWQPIDQASELRSLPMCGGPQRAALSGWPWRGTGDLPALWSSIAIPRSECSAPGRRRVPLVHSSELPMYRLQPVENPSRYRLQAIIRPILEKATKYPGRPRPRLGRRPATAAPARLPAAAPPPRPGRTGRARPQSAPPPHPAQNAPGPSGRTGRRSTRNVGQFRRASRQCQVVDPLSRHIENRGHIFDHPSGALALPNLSTKALVRVSSLTNEAGSSSARESTSTTSPPDGLCSGPGHGGVERPSPISSCSLVSSRATTICRSAPHASARSARVPSTRPGASKSTVVLLSSARASSRVLRSRPERGRNTLEAGSCRIEPAGHEGGQHRRGPGTTVTVKSGRGPAATTRLPGSDRGHPGVADQGHGPALGDCRDHLGDPIVLVVLVQ